MVTGLIYLTYYNINPQGLYDSVYILIIGVCPLRIQEKNKRILYL